MAKMPGRPDMFGLSTTDSEAAVAKAKSLATLDHFINLLQNAQPGDRAAIEAAFKSPDDETEYLWVSSLTYNDGSFHGVVEVDPEMIPSVKMGDSVTVKRTDLDDWLFEHNGKYEGGYFSDLMSKRKGEKPLPR